MFLTKYRDPAVDPFFGPGFWTSLNKWFEPEEESDDFFRVPKTNVNDTENAYVLTMEMPGVEKKNIDVSIENDQIVISGEKSEKTEQKGLLRREIRSEKFRRSFTLGNSVDREKISAKLENGMLVVTLPKQESSVGRKISVD